MKQLKLGLVVAFFLADLTRRTQPAVEVDVAKPDRADAATVTLGTGEQGLMPPRGSTKGASGAALPAPQGARRTAWSALTATR